MPILPDYLANRGETQKAFAARSGLTDSTLSRVLSGKIAPSPEVVEKVHQATDGAVTANDLYEGWRLARGGGSQLGGPDEGTASTAILDASEAFASPAPPIASSPGSAPGRSGSEQSMDPSAGRPGPQHQREPGQ
jgi:transcriptional regulator with XRE-family HTH domain